MKFKSILISMLAVAALASCSKEEAGTTTPDTPDMKGAKAFLSVSIKLPKVAGMYAGAPSQDHGTTDEMTIKNVFVIGFDASNNKVGVYELTAAQQGTIGSNGTTAANGDAFQVSDELKKIFVVINPTANFLTQINAATTYAAMNQAITEGVGLMTDTSGTGFMMTSAGVTNGDLGLVSVTPVVATSESVSDINTAKALAETSPAGVNVDRAMAKVTLSVDPAAIVENGSIMTGSVAWILSATNKQYYPYAELAAGYTGHGKYREDPNFVGSTMADLDWVHNSSLSMAPGTASPFITGWHLPAVSSDPRSFYALENTMEATTQAYGNTTKALIALRYTPTATPTIALGDSWFRVNGVIKTLAQLDADYTAAIASAAGGGVVNQSVKDAYEAFLNTLLGTTRTVGWTGEVKASVVTLADLDAVANGGYKAATVAAVSNMIEYFQKSVCFYSVDINHDEDLAGFTLGRWGIVRNNSYTINIKKISKPGYPYAPDPTDPDIHDPKKPDANKPSDTQSAFISVSITVNPWTTWSQDVEL